MRLKVTHDRQYEWETIRESDAQPGDFLTPANREGDVSRRKVVEQPGNWTLVEWPESEVEREMEARRLAQVPEDPSLSEADDLTRRQQLASALPYPVTRAQLAVEYLSKVGLRHHVPHPGDITHIEDLDGDAAFETFLNTAFGVGSQPAAPVAPVVEPSE